MRFDLFFAVVSFTRCSKCVLCTVPVKSIAAFTCAQTAVYRIEVVSKCPNCCILLPQLSAVVFMFTQFYIYYMDPDICRHLHTLCKYACFCTCLQGCVVLLYGAMWHHADVCIVDTDDTVLCLSGHSEC